MKGKKFASTLTERGREADPIDGAKRKLWHSIDKYTVEIVCFSRGAHAKDLIKSAFMTKWPTDDVQLLT
eukprot:8520607-Pyramimonas_sp.AAC.1